MTIIEIQQQQEAVMPHGDLAPYAGQWVAVRDGEVIAHDVDPERLKEHSEVRAGDALIPVAYPDRGVFVL